MWQLVPSPAYYFFDDYRFVTSANDPRIGQLAMKFLF
jgi:hypothetical protein